MLALSSMSKRSLAQLLSHSCSWHLSSHYGVDLLDLSTDAPYYILSALWNIFNN